MKKFTDFFNKIQTHSCRAVIPFPVIFSYKAFPEDKGQVLRSDPQTVILHIQRDTPLFFLDSLKSKKGVLAPVFYPVLYQLIQKVDQPPFICIYLDLPGFFLYFKVMMYEKIGLIF